MVDLTASRARRRRRKSARSEATGTKGSPERKRCHVNKLPTEVLQKIFSYLKVEEQLLARQVCSRWRAVADSCLALRRDLYLSGKPPPLVTVTDDLLEWLLPRMPRLRCLVIGRAGQQRPLNLDIVSRHCRHLCLAVLAPFHVDEPSLRRLCASCPRLRAVVLPPQCRRRPLLGPLLAELLPQLRYWASQPVCHRRRRRSHRRHRCERSRADN
ncbi:F-box/LRR-repeat protein 8-like [Amphibalanus amphitrite]|uniref:F-box/LRR-repeat protein 8-like n=1 Tax=Amphibalanus amphitrite TaxID=1232801 RepID=UPI001C924784|nr:F-box/LRR-repeat protein 8-like [Amphibalanus amphitrite]XP_043191356.1 F-box/LRR-repeat protein 8-like [Amphibalanus amphitrite]